jgi:hypothetical protein
VVSTASEVEAAEVEVDEVDPVAIVVVDDVAPSGAFAVVVVDPATEVGEVDDVLDPEVRVVEGPSAVDVVDGSVVDEP